MTTFFGLYTQYIYTQCILYTIIINSLYMCVLRFTSTIYLIPLSIHVTQREKSENKYFNIINVLIYQFIVIRQFIFSTHSTLSTPPTPLSTLTTTLPNLLLPLHLTSTTTPAHTTYYSFT